MILLHTTNLYPTPFELVRLGGVSEFQEIAGEYVGLSDHTTSNLASLGAIAIGAILIERHFTDTKERKGPDIINSMTPNELKELKKDSLLMFKMRGGSKLNEIPEEDSIRDFAFATVVATADLKKVRFYQKIILGLKDQELEKYQLMNMIQFWAKKVNKDIIKDSHICIKDLI